MALFVLTVVTNVNLTALTVAVSDEASDIVYMFMTKTPESLFKKCNIKRQ